MRRLSRVFRVRPFILMKDFCGNGHTRAVAAIIEAQDSMLVEITDEKLDLEAYEESVKGVKEEIFTPMTLLAE